MKENINLMFLYFFKLIHRVLLYFQYFNKFSKFLLINTPFTKQIKELLILGLLFKVICEQNRKRFESIKICVSVNQQNSHKLIKQIFIIYQLVNKPNLIQLQIMSGINRCNQPSSKKIYLKVPSDLNVASETSTGEDKNSTTLYQTNYSIHSQSQMERSMSNKNRKRSFKKIKQTYIKQKSIHGGTSKQLKKIEKQEYSSKLIQNLQDVCTIHSRESPRSQKSVKFVFDQSVIILSGKNVEQKPKQFKNEKLPQQRIQEIKKKLINREPPIKQKPFSLQIISKNQNLAINNLGFLIHFQLLQNLQKFHLKVLNTESQGMLKVYTITKLQKVKFLNYGHFYDHKKSRVLVIYQPYTETFSQYLGKQSTIPYAKFLNWILQTLRTLCELFQHLIFPCLQICNLVMINQQVKMILNPQKTLFNQFTKLGIEDSKHLTLKYFGILLNKIFKNLTLTDGKSNKTKLTGLNLFKRVQIRQFIDYLIDQKNNSIAECKKMIKQLLEKQ